MPIRTPSERAYYPASHYEADDLLCWVPAEEYEQMVTLGQIAASVPCDYPDGIEVEVSEASFAEVGLDVGVAPVALRATYEALRGSGKLPDSGIVDGRAIEAIAQERPSGGPAAETAARPRDEMPILEVPEPKMTDGDDALEVMQRLA
jgi:hypothetical protein